MYPNSDVERVEVNDHWVFENDIYLITFKGDSGGPSVVLNLVRVRMDIIF